MNGGDGDEAGRESHDDVLDHALERCFHDIALPLRGALSYAFRVGYVRALHDVGDGRVTFAGKELRDIEPKPDLAGVGE